MMNNKMYLIIFPGAIVVIWWFVFSVHWSSSDPFSGKTGSDVGGTRLRRPSVSTFNQPTNKTGFHSGWGRDPAPVKFGMMNLWLSPSVPEYFGITLQTVCQSGDVFDWWLFVLHDDTPEAAAAARSNRVLQNAEHRCPNIFVRFVSYTAFVEQALKPALARYSQDVVGQLNERRVWFNEQRDWDQRRQQQQQQQHQQDSNGQSAAGEPEQLTGWQSMLRCNRLQWTRGAMWDLFGDRYLEPYNYTHWGFADPDVLHGVSDIRPFLSAREAWAYDVISTREIDFAVPSIHVTGHFQVFLNRPLVNSLWRSRDLCSEQPLTVHELVSTPSMTDEGQFSDCIYRAAGAGHVSVLFRRIEASLMEEPDPACQCHRQVIVGNVAFNEGPSRRGVHRVSQHQLQVRWDPLRQLGSTADQVAQPVGCSRSDIEIPFTRGLDGTLAAPLDHNSEYATVHGAFWVAEQYRWALPESLFYDQDWDLRGCDFAVGGPGPDQGPAVRLHCRDQQLASYVRWRGQTGDSLGCLVFSAQLAEIRAWKSQRHWLVERWPLVAPDVFRDHFFILANKTGLFVFEIDSPEAALI